MDVTQSQPGVAANRLKPDEYTTNFATPTAPMSPAEAHSAAERCLFCADAPCVSACPTEIDVPGFFEQILGDDPVGAAKTIFDQNILGGICARVCPVDVLCEDACVYVGKGQPAVEIARLQRFATDAGQSTGSHPYQRAPETGRKIAVVGAGPAGLACAHGLARLGHDVTLIDARPKPGGLNEYGVAAYKLDPGFAQAEIDWLMQIGGITFTGPARLGRDTTLEQLRHDYDAVFLAMGLAGVNALRTEGETHDHVIDAVDFIADLRQADDLSTVPVGRNVIVLGGGRTALDAAVQARLLGAESVTIAYPDAPSSMDTSEQERLHATSKGVRIITGAKALRVLGDGRAEEVEFAYTNPNPSEDDPEEDTFRIPADQVLKAIGQHLEEAPGGLLLDESHIAVDATGRTSLAGVWAGGDCTAGARDLTVVAVAQGRDAARDIHSVLSNPDQATMIQ